MKAARALSVVVLSATLVGTAGCTQVAQLRGVAGADISAVRTATNDVLVQHAIPIRVAPTCAYDGATYTCQGTTSAGTPITSTAVVRAEYGATTDEWGAPVPADVSLVVTVAGATIYDGTVEAVLQSSGEATP